MSRKIIICATTTQGYDYCRRNELKPQDVCIIPYERFNDSGLQGIELKEGNFVILDEFIGTLLSRMR